jgi:carboxyl-terminal processing protease
MKKFFTLFIFAIFLNSLAFAQPTPNVRNKTTEKFSTALFYLQSAYVDTVNQEALTEHAIRGMLKKLDPHTVYMTSKEMKDANEPLQGNFEGIGVMFNVIEDTITVISAVSGGPSEKVGIQPGDKIVKVDTTNMTGKNTTDGFVMKMLRGPKGSSVKVSILRRGDKKLLEFTIIRDKIPILSVDATYMIDSETGYLKINRFGASTMKEFRDGLRDLKGKGMKNLILDLQGNSGGYLQTAIDLCDEFLGKDKMIVYTEGVHSPKQESNSKIGGMFENGKLIVLIDEGSASASEIVSGCVQDHDRALIVGRRSFGKGLVQNTYLLPDGSAMRITTARYFTPSGRCIQRSYKDGVDAYYKDLKSRYKNGELTHPDSIHVANDSLKYFTDGKRLVFGGGGIMPDFFVPLDTSYTTPYLQKLYSKTSIRDFANSYVDKNRADLKLRYPTVEEFKRNFKVDDVMLDGLASAADKNGVPRNDAEMKTSAPAIKTQMKAIVANQLFNTTAYYQVINDLNPIYKKALELIKDDTFDKMKIAYTTGQ